MTLSRSDLEREAASTGFQAEPLEKIFRLLDLLQSLRSHPFLKGRFALKGGTALNLFLFDIPRLSVDLDLNYIGAGDRETMLSEKPGIEKAINAVCRRAGIRVMRMPGEHAGGKWRLSYGGANRRDWREISLDDIRADPREIEQQLLPMLRADLAPARSDIGAWSDSLVKESRKLLTGLLPLTADEMEFLRFLNDDGEIRPEILTADEDL